MAALVRTLQQDGVLNDVAKLYGIAQTAAEAIVFIQYPVLDADPELYPGRVVPNEALATEVVERLQVDEAFTVGEGSLGFGSTDAESSGESGVPGAEELDGLVGQTAGDETCAVPR